MNYGLYLSASGVLTNMHRQDVHANNLANASTDGFKQSLSTLMQRDPEVLEDQLGIADVHGLLERLGGGAKLAPSRIDLSAGTLKKTERDLDLALQGPGFFAVRVNNETQMTRSGRFTLDAQQRLVTLDGGHPILATNQAPIVVDPAKGKVNIGRDGQMVQDGAPIAQIQLLDAPADRLKALGHGMFVTQGMEPKPATNAAIEQGYLEQSNVDPIHTLMQLIDTTKAIQANANMIRYHDMVMDKAANVLGRVA